MKINEIEKNDLDIVQDKVLSCLSQLISYPSYVGNENEPNAISKILAFTLKYCHELGFEVKNIDNIVGWAEKGTGKTLIVFPVHLDVVPPGDNWDSNPFEMVVKEDVLYGRGVSDNKGAVAMFIHLVDLISQKEVLTNCRIRLIFGTNEESGMSCIKRYIKTEEMPKLGFVPDAMYPVVHGEKGRLHIELEAKLLNNKIFSINGGTQVNSVPDQCELIISKDCSLHKSVCEGLCMVDKGDNWQLNFSGIAAHASNPEKGENAILKALKVLNSAVKEDSVKQLYDNLNQNSNRSGFDIDSEDSIFGNTTFNLGTIKTKEESIFCEIDIRFGRNISKNEILSQIKSRLSDWDVSVRTEKPIHYVPKEEPIMKKLIDIYSYYSNEPKEECIVMGGGTYASYFENFVAFGPKFQKIRTHAHSSNEQVPIENLRKNLQIYYTAIKMLMEETKCV